MYLSVGDDTWRLSFVKPRDLDRDLDPLNTELLILA